MEYSCFTVSICFFITIIFIMNRVKYMLNSDIHSSNTRQLLMSVRQYRIGHFIREVLIIWSLTFTVHYQPVQSTYPIITNNSNYFKTMFLNKSVHCTSSYQITWRFSLFPPLHLRIHFPIGLFPCLFQFKILRA
jgi:hypothetical protein